jgi:cytoskeletal protein CcmA (bactofilin family)
MTGSIMDDTTYITGMTTIKGDIETEGSIDLIGTVKGSVTCLGKLIVGGEIYGNITVGELYANQAHLEGDIHADGDVKIGVGTVIVGNIVSNAAVIAGAVNGDIDVHGPVIVDSTAVIVGNIKSKSVQINNGAVVEGFCSQCYSDVDVKKYFPEAKENKK